MSGSPLDWDTFVAELESALNQAATRASNTPGRLRAAIAVLEDRECELLDASAETVARLGVCREVPIATMPAAAQAELNPLTDRIGYVRRELRELRRQLAAIVPDDHGQYHLLDGSTAQAPLGAVISAVSGVIYVEAGETVDTSKRSDDWLRRHRRHVRELSDRVRVERVAHARRHCSTTHASHVRPRPRRHRCSVTRRSSSSSRTAGQDPGSDSDPASTASDAAGWWL